MKKRIFILTMFFILTMGLVVSGARAATIDLFDWAFNDNGTVYPSSGGPISLPASIDDSAFDWGTGLGDISVSGFGAGSNNFIAFFDHEINQVANGFTNEYGAANGSLPAVQSWEIDEPEFVWGNIYSNMIAGALDNSNTVPFGSPEDVSMALGWGFTLGAGDTAVINLSITEIAPLSGFYLSQTDNDDGSTIYFSGDLGAVK